jgi:DNA polymerase
VDDAVKRAILGFGSTFTVRKVTVATRVISDIPYLLIKLPSGRFLAYPFPRIEDVTHADGLVDYDCITYFGKSNFTHKWQRIKTYGARFVENVTQATAADIMMHGAVNAEATGFDIFALIHDQALAHMPPRMIENQEAMVDEFRHALTHLPKWAKGLPLAAEAEIAPYYKKDV